MARQLTTKAQVNGYRFLLKRLEHALVRRDVRMLHDPMRSQLQALVVGSVLGALLLGGCAVWGIVRPQGTVGDASIVMSKNGGGTYVIIDGTLHPVLNLASARLIVGNAGSPKSVSDDKLAGYARGPLLGIPGAPGALPGSAHDAASTWSVCDTATQGTGGERDSLALTVIGAPVEVGEKTAAAGRSDAALVASGDATYLIYQVERGGVRTVVRAAVDPGSVPVMRALGLDGVVPRPMSAALLNTLTPVDPLAIPSIVDAGAPGMLAVPGVHVGSVVKTVGLDDTTTFHVVLSDGIQQISEAAAAVVRLAGGDEGASVTVAPGKLAALPTSRALPVADFPAHEPHVIGVNTAPTLCYSWARGTGESSASTTLLLGRELPIDADAHPVRLTTADGPGPAVDQVYLTPGSGEYVQATGIESDSSRAESRFYVSDSGVRFGVPDAPTATVLGLDETPRPAPWAIISLLATGPTLSRPAALVSHDGVAPDTRGGAILPPGP